MDAAGIRTVLIAGRRTKMTNMCFARMAQDAFRLALSDTGKREVRFTEEDMENYSHEPDAIIEDIHGDYSPPGPPYYKQPLSDKTFAVCKHCKQVYEVSDG